MESHSCNPSLLTILPQIETISVSDNSVLLILLAIVLVLLAAIISGSKAAYFTLSSSDIDQLKQSESKVNQLILRQLNQPEWLLATISITKSFLIIASVIIWTHILDIQLVSIKAMALKIIIESVIIAFILFVLVEILSKLYTAHHSCSFSRLVAYPIWMLQKITFPLGFLVVKSTSSINQQMAQNANKLSIDEISNALGHNKNELSNEKEMLKGIAKFGNLYVQEIMTPRIDVIDIDKEADFDEVLKIIIDSGYSRIPVFEDTPDNVQGVLYVKDLLPHRNKDKDFKWQTLIRKAHSVPESKKVNILLSEFKAQKIHLAIVVDEYGGTAGIITLEDILEEIVGDINDETDEDVSTHIVLNDGAYLFEGKTLLSDFYKILKLSNTEELEFKSISGDAETVAGLLLELVGEIPKKGAIIEYKHYIFTVISSDNRRINKIKLKQIDNQ